MSDDDISRMTTQWHVGGGALLAPGEVFEGRYEIQRVLGEGGMGVVYAAKDRLLDAEIALKSIRAEHAPTPESARRLLKEGEMARRIRHPNVVSVFDVNLSGQGQPFLSMELLAGETLRAWMIRRQDDVPPAIARTLAIEMLAGLQAAHELGVIHCDLKPENVFLLSEPTEAGARLKLLDFGIAKALTGATMTRIGAGAGTPAYMAPEQTTMGDAVQPSADFYALSAILYELLMEAPPAHGGTVAIREDRPDVPEALEALIRRGLKMRPKSRPASAAEYLEALKPEHAQKAAPEPKPEPDPAPQSKTPPPDASAAPFGDAFKDVFGSFFDGAGGKSAPQARPKRPAGSILRDPLRSGGEGPAMAVIPAGSFQMGSPDSEAGRLVDEGPQRSVSFENAFALGRFAVSFDEFDAYCAATGAEGANDADWGRGSNPVIDVNWHDAQDYCAWLSDETGETYRLPSEAEWEYACRAGTTTPFWLGRAITADEANFDAGGGGMFSKSKTRNRTVPVDTFLPNPWGLFQMHGNVCEWCQDCMTDSYAGAPTNGSAVLTGDCALRAVRGGAWDCQPEWIRSAYRNWNQPEMRNAQSGFRVARDLQG